MKPLGFLPGVTVRQANDVWHAGTDVGGDAIIVGGTQPNGMRDLKHVLMGVPMGSQTCSVVSSN